MTEIQKPPPSSRFSNIIVVRWGRGIVILIVAGRGRGLILGRRHCYEDSRFAACVHVRQLVKKSARGECNKSLLLGSSGSFYEVKRLSLPSSIFFSKFRYFSVTPLLLQIAPLIKDSFFYYTCTMGRTLRRYMCAFLTAASRVWLFVCNAAA